MGVHRVETQQFDQHRGNRVEKPQEKAKMGKPFNKFNKGKSEQQGADKKCNSCGFSNHNFVTCKYKEYKCKLCHKKKHLAKMCWKNKNNNNFVEVEDEISASDHEVAEMYFVSVNNEFLDPMKIQVLVNNKPLLMEIDSGSRRSMLPEQLYLEKFKEYILHASLTRLKTYEQNIIIPQGEIEVDINYKDNCKRCKLIIVRNGTTPLLGRDLMHLFDLIVTDEEIAPVQVNNVENDLDLNSLIREYDALFKEELGGYKYEEVELEMDSNSKPIFVKPPPVPFAFKKMLEDELDRLEKEGAIVKVDNSEWGTPLLPVIKNGKMRLCADYKVTVNKALKNDNYPRVEELFAAMEGGECYTKLDFRSAYNLLILTDETSLVLAWSTQRAIYRPRRLPYGTKPAPSRFQKIVEKVLQGVSGVKNFQDDVIVTGRNKQEHLTNLEEVFN